MNQQEPSKKRSEESAEENFFGDLPEKADDHRGSCWFMILYFGLIYLVLVASLWQIGRLTHLSGRQLAHLQGEATLEDIREGLAEQFGIPTWLKWPEPSLPTPEMIKESVTDSVTDSVKEKLTDEVENVIP